MKLKISKPVTNGTRHQVNLQKNLLAKGNRLIKASMTGLKSMGGRSSTTGRITVWHQGGSCKKLNREIDFSSRNFNGLVLFNTYDPQRNSFISLNFDLDSNSFFYTLATNSVYPGSLVTSSEFKNELRLGNRTSLEHIPTGSVVHSISHIRTNKTVFARAAGTYCQLIQKGSEFCKLRLPSGSISSISIKSFATLGTVSNPQDNLVCIGKAGKNRLRGIRPTVRGIAMNPVDHPHGGRTNGGRPSVTPWGIPTKGKPTVSKKKI
jgi:large subunit ribosomal protein L2